MEHLLARCVFCELQFTNRLKYPLRDFDHVDEMCDQLYMDTLGYGVNGRLRKDTLGNCNKQ